MIGLLTTLSVVAALELPFKCTESNCILSNFTVPSFHEDPDLDFSSAKNEDDILAVKFESCDFYSLPFGIFFRLKSVLCLMASEPGFESLDADAFKNADSLQFLYLPNNRITQIPQRAFHLAPNLNEIDLSFNYIREIKQRAFASLEHLETLNLRGNEILSISNNVFDPLTSLTVLDLSENKLQFLWTEMFAENKNLNSINVAANQINTISTNIMNELPWIKVLNLIDNPCTKDTMLDNIPLIRLLDNSDLSPDDEKVIQKCYIKVDEEDVTNLLSAAAEVEEDLEKGIIDNLNEELREKDEKIKKLEDETERIAFLALISTGIAILILLSKYAQSTVNKVYESQIEKFNKKDDEAKDEKPQKQNDGCFVIDIKY